MTSQPLLLVALGASNTAGWGVGAARAWPAVVERLLGQRGVDARVLNAGLSGNTTGEMLGRLADAVPAGTRLVLLQPGSNDARLAVPVAETERNIRTIVDILAGRGIAVIRVAKAFEAARAGNLQPDGIHFTEAGHEAIGRLLVDEVEAALRTLPPCTGISG